VKIDHSGWDYRCCAIAVEEIRLMTDKEYRSVKRPAVRWLIAFLLVFIVLAIPKPEDPTLRLLLSEAKGLYDVFSLFALWLVAVYGRCALHRTVMVFHGKPIVAEQFKLAGLPCQSPLKLSKEPVTIRVYWPVCLVQVESDLWQPHPWFRRRPHALKLTRIARGESEFSGSRKLNRRERRELVRHTIGAFLKVFWTSVISVLFLEMIGRSFKSLGSNEIAVFMHIYGDQVLLAAIAVQFFWIYRAILMLLDCLWGRVFRHPGSEFSWLRISRTMWQRDGKPAKWRENPDLMKYPVAALSRYARENLSYHKRGIGDERAI